MQIPNQNSSMKDSFRGDRDQVYLLNQTALADGISVSKCDILSESLSQHERFKLTACLKIPSCHHDSPSL